MATNIVPGTGKHATVTNPTALAGSVSQNPTDFLLSMEGTAAKSKYTTVTDSGPLVPDLVLGSALLVLLVLLLYQLRADGTETAKATTI